MRKLASIKKVSEIQPIDGRDRIVLATIDGWHVIVQKDEYNVGDLCVYVEIDSVMPAKPEFAFLEKKGYRIKTMKMAGVISQGICFPMSILPEGRYKEEDDVTDVIGVKQYEATMDKEPEPTKDCAKHYPAFLMRYKWFRQLVLGKKQSKGFPTFISKTDETRIQNAPFYLKDKSLWVATEKVDGQSGTFALKRQKSKFPFVKDKFEYIVCSRNNRLYKPDSSTYWSVSCRYQIEEKLKTIIGNNEWVAIQGECVGPKVQGNKYKVTTPDLYVFNVIFPDGRVGSTEAAEICKNLDMKFVPIIDTGVVLPDTVDEILAYAHGTSALHNTLREGIVFRSQDGKRSFKAVDPLFLMKHDE